jgi:Mlc titration factor MtfA (ptsG expression regulator)
VSLRGGDLLAWAEAGLIALVAATLGAVALGPAGAAGGALAGAGLGALRLRRALSATARRRAAETAPFPGAWRTFLEERYDHYDRLPDAMRSAFESRIMVFLAETRITGVGVEITDELRLLVAASASTLSLAWPGHAWEQLAEVLVYARDFDRDYSFDNRELSGEAHPWGTIILSAPTLEDSFDDPDDGYHVGLHEFAHLADMWGGSFDGIPAGFDDEKSRRWLALAARERERMRVGRSVIDVYGAESDVEFLAVAVEAFFERPLALRKGHGEVYEMLRDYFGQDPAAWDDARGLALRR